MNGLPTHLEQQLCSIRKLSQLLYILNMSLLGFCIQLPEEVIVVGTKKQLDKAIIWQ